jgi:hypothetical protein
MIYYTLYRNEKAFALIRPAADGGFICQEIYDEGGLDWNDYKLSQAQLDFYLAEDGVRIEETPISGI